MSRPNPDEITGLDKGDAQALVREISQIATSPAAKLRLKKDQGRQKHPERPEARQQSSPSQSARTTNPKVLGRKMHEINTQMGNKSDDGSYFYSGANYEIHSKNPKNVTVTRKGEQQPALKISKGSVKVNNLSDREAATIHKSHQKVVDRGVEK